ncbi:endonuclease/exonuclease/phosphatase family protein [Shimia sp. NS0008-38b]|uniref:endonuclease/exonuclease/phosphatase family protein n=1 Tax=Shimia sp. NS0008-38b TaxID=3127653 RepID=UPI003340DF2C
MRLRWLILCVVVMLVGLGTVPTGQAERRAPQCGSEAGLRVMTYNIRTGLGVRHPGANPRHHLFESHDIAPVAAAIAAADPDVVAVQEVLGWGQAARLARRLNMDHHFVFHPSPFPWWGTAILSKCALKDRTRVVTSRGAGNGKAMAVARVDVRGTPIVVSSVHRDRDDNSGAQVTRILEALPTDAPVVLAGDFNFEPDDSRHARVTQRFGDTLARAAQGANLVEARGTYPSVPFGKRGRRIDYIYVSDGFEVRSVAVIEGLHAQASDHLALVTHVRWKTKQN